MILGPLKPPLGMIGWFAKGLIQGGIPLVAPLSEVSFCAGRRALPAKAAGALMFFESKQLAKPKVSLKGPDEHQWQGVFFLAGWLAWK